MTTSRMRLALAAGVLVAAAAGISRISAQDRARGSVTPADYLRWRTELRNWGRWGPNDQKGTANLITPAKVQSSARLVRSGIVVSLAHPVPQQQAADVTAGAALARNTHAISATNKTRQ